MLFQPAIATSGYTGWLVLQKTEANQRETFEESPVLINDIEYFRKNISSALTAEDLVNDRRLLTVALGAFGLADEINKKAFIQKILEGGTENGDALANKLGDPRYRKFADAFGYGNVDAGSSVLLSTFREDVIARYKSLEFDRAVGEVDNDMRLALNFRREIAEIANPESEKTTAWFQIMGQKPLREVIATAFNIPPETAQLDLDRQQEMFSERAKSLLGDSNPTMFQELEKVDDVLRRFFLMRQIENGPSAATPGFAALSLLQGASLGASASANLLLSQA